MSRDLFLILGVIFLFFAAQTAVQVVVPIAASAAQLSGAAIGLLVAIPAGVALVIDVPLSALSDALGRRLPIVVGAAVGSVAALILMRALDLPTFVLGAVVWALAASLVAFPALAYVTEAAHSRQHARIQGYNGSVQRIAFMTGTLAVGVLLDVGHGSGIVLAAVAIATAAVVLLVIPLGETRERGPLPGTAEIRASYRRAAALLGRPAMLLSALIALTNGAVVQVIGNAFIPLYLIRDLQQEPVLVGGLLAWRNFVAAALSYRFGTISARVGLLPLVLGTNAIAAASVLLMPLSDAIPYLFVVLGLQGVGYAFSAGTGNILIASATSGPERALGFATNHLVARIGTLALPLLLGWLLEVQGAHTVFVAGGVFVLATVAWMGVVVVGLRRGG